MHTIDVIEADARAVRASVEVVALVKPADLGSPTPCAEWDLAALLRHMTAEHRAFAAAAGGAEPAPADDYATAAAAVLRAFAQPGVLDRPIVMPGFGAELPGRLIVGFHLVDYLVHGWDVARALGVPYEPDPAVVAVALPIVRQVPDDESRRAPGAPFGPGLPVPPDADPFTEILRRLGRS